MLLGLKSIMVLYLHPLGKVLGIRDSLSRAVRLGPA